MLRSLVSRHLRFIKVSVPTREMSSHMCCEAEKMTVHCPRPRQCQLGRTSGSLRLRGRRCQSVSVASFSNSVTDISRISGSPNKVEDQALGALNTLSAEELYKYEHITKQIAAGITKQRRISGIFSSLEELLQVPGITEERLKKIASSLHKKQLKSSKSKNQTLRGLGSLIHPRLKLTEVPSSVVSIHMQLPHVSWVKLSDSLDIEDWCTMSLTENNKPLKYDHASHQTKIWKLCQQIPRADIYLLEDAPLRVSTTQIMPTLNRNYAEATLTTALNYRHLSYSTKDTETPSGTDGPVCSPDGQMVPSGDVLTDTNAPNEFKHSVYKLKPKAVSSYFSLLVGGERICSLDLLRDIRDGTCEASKGVIIEPDVWQELCELPKVLQDQRAQTLLVATTFYKLLSSERTTVTHQDK